MTAQQERRTTSRRRVFFGAAIECDTLATPVNCQVRSMSDAGAMLASFSHQSLPMRFGLRLAAQNRHFHAEIIWRAEGKVGVKFVAPPQRQAAHMPTGANDNGASRIAELRARFVFQEA